jgi:L-seryl-tRNA(Ser) seleniumtransferase
LVVHAEPVSVDPRRQVPRTDVLLADDRLTRARTQLGDGLVKGAMRRAQERARRGELPVSGIVDAVLGELPRTASSLQAVLNATGVVLHTNIGRSPLSPAAVEALVAAAGYVDVEFDLARGVRARRGRGVIAAMLRAVPDAEDALVVNNGAAAVALVAAALAGGREIILSRGELIEIGDGFRIPALIESTGARLREVGTTNRTHLADYAEAVGERTAFILKVHPSNFAVRGFTASVPVAELASLGVPVIADIGSGLLHPNSGLPGEPDATSWLRAGASLVTASGDKLLGGPQAGLIFGAADLVSTLRRHPLQRALRVDKLTLAALEATIVGPPPPIAGALGYPPDALRARTEAVAEALRSAGETAEVVPHDGLVGGGGAPELTLSGWAIRLHADYAGELRRGRPAVLARVEADHCLLDLRCIPVGADPTLHEAIAQARRRLAAEGR